MYGLATALGRERNDIRLGGLLDMVSECRQQFAGRVEWLVGRGSDKCMTGRCVLTVGRLTGQVLSIGSAPP